MKKALVALCLSAGMLACMPGMSLADVNFVPQNTSAVPSIPASTLQRLIWTPADQSKTQSVDSTAGGQRLDVPGIIGLVAAWSIPANTGELILILGSELNRHKQIFAPDVLTLDRNMTPAAFFPNNYFTYQQPGVITVDRLDGVMRLTPALGQQELYVLVFTTEKDLQQTTTLLDPAKAYAKGAGNVAPSIPDPIAKHTAGGVLKLKVKTNSTPSVLVGPLFGFSGPGPAIVGNITAPMVAPAAAAAATPAAESKPVLSDTEAYFNNGVKQTMKQSDADKALKLMNETERLGSKPARSTFISSVRDKR